MSKPLVNVAMLGGEVFGLGSLTVRLVAAIRARNEALRLRGSLREPPTLPLDHRLDSPPYPTLVETSHRQYMLLDYTHFRNPARFLFLASGCLDAAVLVVSTHEGARIQTRQHLLLARHAGVHRIVVALDVIPGADEMCDLDMTEHEVRSLLAEYGFPADDVPIVRGGLDRAASHPDDDEACQGIDELVATLDRSVPVPSRDPNGPLLVGVERTPDLTLLYGTDEFFDGEETPEEPVFYAGWILRGALRVGGEVQCIGITPGGSTFKITEIRVLGQPREVASPGERVYYRLTPLGGETNDGLTAGQVLITPGSVRPHRSFEAACYCPTRWEGGEHDMLSDPFGVSVFIRGRSVPASVVLPREVTQVRAGQHVRLTVQMEELIVLEQGTPFVLSDSEGFFGYGTVTRIRR